MLSLLPVMKGENRSISASPMFILPSLHTNHRAMGFGGCVDKMQGMNKYDRANDQKNRSEKNEQPAKWFCLFKKRWHDGLQTRLPGQSSQSQKRKLSGHLNP